MSYSVLNENYRLKVENSSNVVPDAQHYNELKRSIGSITNTMLTKSLRELEEDGLLKRISKGTVPPSVTYHLTDTGKDLIYTMGDLFEWGKNLMEETQRN